MIDITELSQQVADYYNKLKRLKMPQSLIEQLVTDYQNRVMDRDVIKEVFPQETK